MFLHKDSVKNSLQQSHNKWVFFLHCNSEGINIVLHKEYTSFISTELLRTTYLSTLYYLPSLMFNLTGVWAVYGSYFL